MDPRFLLLGRALFSLTLFMSLMFLLFLIRPCNLCLLGRSLTMTVVFSLILMFAIFRIITLVTWLALTPIGVIHNVFGSLTDFVFLLLCPPVLSAPPMLLHPCHHMLSSIIVWATFVALNCLLCFVKIF
jgi:hypothetical protein